MNAATHRNTLLASLTLALGALSAAGSVLAEDIDESNTPVWTAGGHYTAELSLRSAELALFPLAGEDQQVSVRHACSPGRTVAEGVYLLIGNEQGYELQRTHPNGQTEELGMEQIALATCNDYNAPSSALRLPPEVLSAFKQAAVGAIYIRP